MCADTVQLKFLSVYMRLYCINRALKDFTMNLKEWIDVKNIVNAKYKKKMKLLKVDFILRALPICPVSLYNTTTR